jgi:predicted phosphohydrolase
LSIFAIGDLHLSTDPRIEKPMDIFGEGWVDHAARLKKNWTEEITNDDTVIICGDISWGLKLDEALADFRWIESLPGHKVITKGNHDLWWTSKSKLNGISEGITFVQNDCCMVGKTAICGTRGWICPGTEGFDEHDEKIYKREILRLRMSLDDARAHGAETIIASLHYPPTNDKFDPSGFTEVLSEYGVKTCVYGHLHGADVWGNGYKGILNGVEYRLVSLDFVGARPVKII